MANRMNIVVFFVALLCILVNGYERKPCRGRSVRSQFQLPKCRIPELDTSLLLSSASFLMSHNAATGYMKRGSMTSMEGMIKLYSKNQKGSVYDQLNDGARALDLRPKLLADGSVIFQHNTIDIPVSFEQVVSDAVRWCSDNPNELVLLLPSHFEYESSSNNNNKEQDNGEEQEDADDYSIVSAMQAVYNQLGVPYYDCGSVYGLTVGQTMQLAALPSGGYLIALDGQDKDGTFCGKPNYVESQIVTCHSNQYDSCTSSKEPLESLKNYVLASANNDATDDSYTLGPPENLYDTPFNEIQGLWQVTEDSAKIGLTKMSTLLQDNKKSNVNAEMVEMIYNGEFNAINLFAVDNVALNGNALLSVLRTACGQSTLETCGQELEKPKMKNTGGTAGIITILVLAIVMAIGTWVGWTIYDKRQKNPSALWNTMVAQICSKSESKVYTSNKEELLQS